MAFTTLPARDSTAALHRHWKQQRMVVQMPASVPDAGNVLRSVQTTSADAADTSKLRVQVLSLPDILLTNRLVAQTSAQPGRQRDTPMHLHAALRVHRVLLAYA